MPDTSKLKWSNEEVDLLLKLFIDLEWEWDSIAKEFAPKRTKEALSTEIWLLAARYNRSHIRNYKPPGPPCFHFRAYSAREHAIMCVATGKTGVKNNACDPEWIARILGRSEESINIEMNRLYEEQLRHKPMFAGRKLNRYELVHKALSRELKQVKQELGSKK
jgi:hypothetical protein